MRLKYHIMMRFIKEKLWYIWHVRCCNGNAGGWRTSFCNSLNTGWRYHDAIIDSIIDQYVSGED